jgi:ParB family chromosome partitioning protein
MIDGERFQMEAIPVAVPSPLGQVIKLPEFANPHSEPEPPIEDDQSPVSDIQLIPLDSIRVINPRFRNRKKYREIINNISDVGLKKPITVCRRTGGGYDLVCGQGRLEACIQLGQIMVPAIIKDISTEDALLMSLVENIARKKPTTMETIRQLAILRDRGYKEADIAKKTGIIENQVYVLLHLFDHGEEQLLSAIEMGRISAASAAIIARSEHSDVQRALLEAVEQDLISPAELTKARVVADRRKAFARFRNHNEKSATLTREAIVRTFRREQQKQRQALKRADLCETRLFFVTNALKMLFRDENFVNLLRAEGLESMPEYLAEKIKEGKDNG